MTLHKTKTNNNLDTQAMPAPVGPMEAVFEPSAANKANELTEQYDIAIYTAEL